MTPEQEDMVLGLVVVPGGSLTVAPERVLRAFGFDDGRELSRQLIGDAAASRSATDMGLAMIAAYVFGVADDVADDLVEFLYCDWHHSHEDLVGLLAKAAVVRAVPALQRVATWVPEYLDFDESRSLAQGDTRVGADTRVRGHQGAGRASWV